MLNEVMSIAKHRNLGETPSGFWWGPFNPTYGFSTKIRFVSIDAKHLGQQPKSINKKGT